MTQPDFSSFMEKIQHLRTQPSQADVDITEDLSIGVMNLIALEEHFFFTANKTHKDEYFDLAHQVRTLRTEMMKKLLPHNEGETRCASKHLLTSCMRLIEVGTKLQTLGQKQEAIDIFHKAYDLYSLFRGIRMNLITLEKNPTPDISVDIANKPMSLNDIVGELANCCNEG